MTDFEARSPSLIEIIKNSNSFRFRDETYLAQFYFKNLNFQVYEKVCVQDKIYLIF